MSIVDLVKYFARFVPASGVLQSFAAADDVLPGYADLKNFITAMPQTHVLHGLTRLIWSTDEKEVSDSVRTLDGYFLYLEHGLINVSAPAKFRNRNQTKQIGLIVAHHWNSPNLDSPAEAIILDTCLDYIRQIARQMQIDDLERCGITRLIDSSLKIMPVEPYLLYESFGYEMSFEVQTSIL